MMSERIQKIPLTIGVTGHLNLREADRALLYETAKQELTKIRERCPHTPVVLLSALARGADLLCAEAAEELGIPLRGVFPMEPAEYEKDFGPEDLARMRHQTKLAEAVFTAPAAEAEPAETDRDFRYRQAGIYMAEHSHILLALWDGKAGTDVGTGGAVRAALEGAWQPCRGMACRNAENIAVVHVLTPREGDDAGKAGTVELLGNRKALEEILARTEEFNRLAEEVTGGGDRLLPESTGEPEMERLEALYSAADSLSVRFAKIYRRTLGILAVLGPVVAFAFLLYDEAELPFMILLCGITLLAAILVTGAAKRTAGHRRYIERNRILKAVHGNRLAFRDRKAFCFAAVFYIVA